LRTTLTVLAIALPMFVFTMARTMVEQVHEMLAESDLKLRVAVHQKLSFTSPLPQRIREEIEGLAPEGYITAVCRTSWFGGRIEGKPAAFASMAVDRDTFAKVYAEFEITPAENERFQEERRAAMVSPELAKSQNWKVGDRVTLTGSLPPNPKMEFVIVAIPPKMSRQWFYFAMDYYDETLRKLTGSPAGVNNFWVKCSSPEARQWALTAIDKHFASSENETRTELESTFFAQFMKSGGDWVGLTWNVGRLIVLVAVAVAFNTMSMSFRERTREIAVLRTLGFSAGKIVRMVLSEGVLLGLIGGLIAVGPIYALTHLTEFSIPRMGTMQIPNQTAAIALAVACLCGLLAALVPALMAGRLKVATALRKVV